jgi:hypothetical protein
MWENQNRTGKLFSSFLITLLPSVFGLPNLRFKYFCYNMDKIGFMRDAGIDITDELLEFSMQCISEQIRGFCSHRIEHEEGVTLQF